MFLDSIEFLLPILPFEFPLEQPSISILWTISLSRQPVFKQWKETRDPPNLVTVPLNLCSRFLSKFVETFSRGFEIINGDNSSHSNLCQTFSTKGFAKHRIREITLYFVENSGVLRAIRALLKPREIFTTVERPPLAENFETYSKGKQRDTGVKQFHEMTVYSIPCLAGHESKLILPSY